MKSFGKDQVNFRDANKEGNEETIARMSKDCSPTSSSPSSACASRLTALFRLRFPKTQKHKLFQDPQYGKIYCRYALSSYDNSYLLELMSPTRVPLF